MAYCAGESIAPMIYSESTTGSLFESWVEDVLVPDLKTNSVIILDNAHFHRKKQLAALAQKYSFKILWLPPYSPDKNPIEKKFATFKNWLRRDKENYSCFVMATLDYFTVI